jgi:hypothetical protein
VVTIDAGLEVWKDRGMSTKCSDDSRDVQPPELEPAAGAGRWDLPLLVIAVLCGLTVGVARRCIDACRRIVPRARLRPNGDPAAQAGRDHGRAGKI